MNTIRQDARMHKHLTPETHEVVTENSSNLQLILDLGLFCEIQRKYFTCRYTPKKSNGIIITTSNRLPSGNSLAPPEPYSWLTGGEFDNINFITVSTRTGQKAESTKCLNKLEIVQEIKDALRFCPRDLKVVVINIDHYDLCNASTSHAKCIYQALKEDYQIYSISEIQLYQFTIKNRCASLVHAEKAVDGKTEEINKKLHDIISDTKYSPDFYRRTIKYLLNPSIAKLPRHKDRKTTIKICKLLDEAAIEVMKNLNFVCKDKVQQLDLELDELKVFEYISAIDRFTKFRDPKPALDICLNGKVSILKKEGAHTPQLDQIYSNLFYIFIACAAGLAYKNMAIYMSSIACLHRLCLIHKDDASKAISASFQDLSGEEGYHILWDDSTKPIIQDFSNNLYDIFKQLYSYFPGLRIPINFNAKETNFVPNLTHNLIRITGGHAFSDLSRLSFSTQLKSVYKYSKFNQLFVAQYYIKEAREKNVSPVNFCNFLLSEEGTEISYYSQLDPPISFFNSLECPQTQSRNSNDFKSHMQYYINEALSPNGLYRFTRFIAQNCKSKNSYVLIFLSRYRLDFFRIWSKAFKSSNSSTIPVFVALDNISYDTILSDGYLCFKFADFESEKSSSALSLWRIRIIFYAFALLMLPNDTRMTMQGIDTIWLKDINTQDEFSTSDIFAAPEGGTTRPLLAKFGLVMNADFISIKKSDLTKNFINALVFFSTLYELQIHDQDVINYTLFWYWDNLNWARLRDYYEFKTDEGVVIRAARGFMPVVLRTSIDYSSTQRACILNTKFTHGENPDYIGQLERTLTSLNLSIP
jgi:hypothetical protein